MNEKQLPSDLFNAGFLHATQRTSYDYPLSHSAKITAVAKWIESNLTNSDAINPEWNSYSLKCLYKDATGQELTNGEFIAAMITAGFTCNRSGLNGMFNVCGKSVQQVEEKSYISLTVKMAKGGTFLPSANKFNALSLVARQSIIEPFTKGKAAGKPFTYAYLKANNLTIRFMKDEKGKILEAEASTISM
jgi:hypothetical protein